MISVKVDKHWGGLQIEPYESNNIYPLNLVFHAIGLLGWLLVGMFWVDRSLIVVNAIGLSVILNSLVIYLIDAFKL